MRPSLSTKEEIIDINNEILRWKPFRVPNSQFNLDCLQAEMIKKFVQTDQKFRAMFAKNFTMTFLQYLSEKCKLREPILLSTMGSVRSGKSSAGITMCAFILHKFGKTMTADRIVENEYARLDRIKFMTPNDCIQVDESKQDVYGGGVHARQSKIKDINNIIAVNNISAVFIRPDKFCNETDVSYGLRAFGRMGFVCNKCNTQLDLEAGRVEYDMTAQKFVVKKAKACPKCGESKDINPRLSRFMLYNLTESRGSHYVPQGMVYLPHYADILQYGEKLERDYLAKKQLWVQHEQRGENDVLAGTKLKAALSFAKDKRLAQMVKKQQRFVYLSTMLGSEYTINEIKDILTLIDLVNNGLIGAEDVQQR